MIIGSWISAGVRDGPLREHLRVGVLGAGIASPAAGASSVFETPGPWATAVAAEAATAAKPASAAAAWAHHSPNRAASFLQQVPGSSTGPRRAQGAHLRTRSWAEAMGVRVSRPSCGGGNHRIQVVLDTAPPVFRSTRSTHVQINPAVQQRGCRGPALGEWEHTRIQLCLPVCKDCWLPARL